MTVQELAQRLARWTASKTLSQMSVEDRLILLDCVNSAVFNWFITAPENLRMTTVSHLIRAKETISFTATNGGNDMTGASLQDYHLGAALEIAGEKNMNEIVSVSGTPKMLNQFRGSTGSVSASVHFDTIMLTDHSVNRLVSHPRVLDTGVTLFRDEDGLRFVGPERRMRAFSGILGTTAASSSVQTFGDPTRYVLENTGVSQKDEARLMVRLDPIPDKEMTVVFDAVLDPPSHDLTDMDGSVAVAVPDQYVLPHVLPLALSDLVMTPIWEGSKEERDATIQRGISAIAAINRAMQPNRGSPSNYVRTRPGY
tara:strand:+ start:4182 stop:5117 length:936 start_codon:yes stop_codon:yes gene_type:complete